MLTTLQHFIFADVFPDPRRSNRRRSTERACLERRQRALLNRRRDRGHAPASRRLRQIHRRRTLLFSHRQRLRLHVHHHAELADPHPPVRPAAADPLLRRHHGHLNPCCHRGGQQLFHLARELPSVHGVLVRIPVATKV